LVADRKSPKPREPGQRALGQTEVRWAVLSVLSGGARTVPQVARRLGVTRQSVQRVANLLAAEGLIESVENPDNARSPLFRLSKRVRRSLPRSRKRQIRGSAA
jgi:DNA-binding MarR family transcriptional regulator